ncbi:MAG: DHHW family protein [Clostridium sp.]|nr:DHHW family protein [Clostridium sp.]
MEEKKGKEREKKSWRHSAYQALPFFVLLGMLVFFGIWQAAAKKRTYSVSERRLLAGKPVLTKESLLDASYMNAYEEYLTDQFPMRDQWITMKTYCGMLLGRRESGGVYIARDNSLIELHMPEIAKEETAGRNEECLIGFLRDMEEAGVEHVRVMLVPTADGIWREKLSPYAEPFDQQAYLARFYETLSEQGLSGCYVDVWEQLAAHAGGQIYYKTDHHWTMRGAYLGYTAYAASLSGADGAGTDGVGTDGNGAGGAGTGGDGTDGVTWQGDQSGIGIPAWSDYGTEVVRTDFHGTTAAKCGLYHVNDELVLVYPPENVTERYRVRYDGGISESDSLYERKHVYGDDPYSVYLDGNHAVTEIFVTREHAQESGPGAEARRRSLLVIKDSYANCFVPYLTGIYDEITVIDLRYYNGSLRALEEEHSYTDVLVLYNLPNFLTETTVYRMGK